MSLTHARPPAHLKAVEAVKEVQLLLALRGGLGRKRRPPVLRLAPPPNHVSPLALVHVPDFMPKPPPPPEKGREGRERGRVMRVHCE